MVSVDSKYDQGRVSANNPNQDFANFTRATGGKTLFFRPPD